MITQEQKDKWVAALRSGEYKQAEGCLFDGEGHCCLGVYVDAVQGIKVGTSPDADYELNRVHYDNLNDIIGGFTSRHTPVTTTLMMMNDEGRSFSEIADFIEAYVPAENQDS